MYDILRDIVKKSSTNKPFRENISKRLGSLRIFLSFRYDLRKCITPKRQTSACVYNIMPIMLQNVKLNFKKGEE